MPFVLWLYILSRVCYPLIMVFRFPAFAGTSLPPGGGFYAFSFYAIGIKKLPRLLKNLTTAVTGSVYYQAK